jgi:hypothetical protein
MKFPGWPSLSSRQRKFTRRAAWAVLAYALIGFLILPPIVRIVAVKQLTKQLDREVSIRSVRLNPFALSATVRGLLIKDKDGQPFVSWDEVYVNFQLASLFGKAWIFSEVSTTKPFVRVQMNKDFTLNFSDLVTKFSPPAAAGAAPKQPATPLALRIGKLRIVRASASYTDLTLRTPFQRVLGPLDLDLDNFRTDPANKNPYSFAGTTDAGEKFSWSGYFFLDPVRSRGELSLENITLNKFSPLYQDFVRWIIKDGRIGVRADYDLELSAAHRVLAVSNAAFELRSLKIAAPGSSNNLVELARFAVQGANVDAVAHTARVGLIAGHGGRLDLRRDQNAAVNVVELSKPASLENANTSGGILLLLRSVTNAVNMLLSSTNQWAATVQKISVWDFSLSLEDLVNSRPARLALDQISLDATNLSNLPGQELTATLSHRWNTNGSLKLNVTASFLPPTVDADIALDQIDLHPLDPYLESSVNLIVLNSKLGLHGHVSLRTPKDQLPEVTFAGDTSLDDFSTVDGVLGEDLLAWKSLRVSGISANLNPPAVTIKEIAVDDAVARVVVETNHTINLLAALHPAKTNAAPVMTNAPVVSTAPAGPLPKIAINSIVISNAQAKFTDRSVEPHVRVALQQINGTISGLSSDELQHADVNLHASVGAGAPVDITGTINPLAKNQTTDLKVTMKNLDLTPESPYAGRFAGYGISRGKLHVELAYQLSDQKLKASNLIELDQFTFGQKVNSPDATKLPVRLAIAILKDRDGKIKLDVPIEGSLGDPQFHLGKVISRAVMNIIVKIATSPFSVLGALFGGGGEELGYQDFAPGSAVLQTNEMAKLDGLVKGLYERPALQVAIEGSIDPVADTDGLRRLKLEKQLRALKWQSLRAAARANVKPEEIVLSADEHADLLKKFLQEALARGPLNPPPTNRVASASASTPTSPRGPRFQPANSTKGGAVMMASQNDALLRSAAVASAANPAANGSNGADLVTQAAMSTIEILDVDFVTLANARAEAVKAYLLQSGKVEADRIFLTSSEPGAVKNDGGRAYLQLQ